MSNKEKDIKLRNVYCEYGSLMIVSADLISSSFDEDEYGLCVEGGDE